jgi:hypothetical protein
MEYPWGYNGLYFKTIEESLITIFTRILLFWHFRIARIELNVIECKLNGIAGSILNLGPQHVAVEVRGGSLTAPAPATPKPRLLQCNQCRPSPSVGDTSSMRFFLPKQNMKLQFWNNFESPKFEGFFPCHACSTYLLQWKAARYISVLKMTRTDYIFYSD